MPTFAFPNDGALAERLGTGLQNLLQRFDSARHLKKTPLSIAERGFAILDLATTLLQIKKTPNHFIDSESGGIQNEVAFRQQHLSQRYSNFSINQSLTIFVSGTGELKN